MARRMKTLLIFLVTLAATMFVWIAYMYAVHYRFGGSVETVYFHSDEITLRGWFVKPGGAGPHPAVIILHGSGPETGDSAAARVMTNALLRSDVSVLTYDKRGVGGSGGDFVKTAYGDFIEDGIRAVQYLKSRSDVATDAIGLLGSSEGGWFAPEIAHRTGDVSFIINRVGPPLPWIETNLWEARHDLMADGVLGDVLDESLRIRDMVWRFVLEVDADPALAGGEKWKRIDAALAGFDVSHGSYIKKLPDYDPAFYGRLAAYIGYDPQPYIERLSIPMLYVFAGEDENVPTAEAVAYLQALQTQEGKDVEFRVIPGVKHNMLSAAALFSGGFDPAFIDLIGPWAATKAR